MIRSLTPAPLWTTPAGPFAEVAEGQTVALRFAARVAATGPVAGATVAIGPSAPFVVAARIAGSPALFSAVGESVVIPAAPPRDDYLLELDFDLTPALSLLNGSLPPGVSFGASGGLEGVVGEIEPTVTGDSGPPREHRFTVRARHGNEVRDRTFVLRAAWTDSRPAFSASLFAAYQDVGGGLRAFVMPAARQGRAYAFAFEAEDGDSPLPPAAVSRPASPPAGATLLGLPSALSLNAPARRIEGVVGVATPPGTYLFDLALPRADRSLAVALPVLPRADEDEGIAPVLVVSWITPPGSLGAPLRDGDLAPLAVRAETSTGAEVTYEVLPPERDALAARGLRLDPERGELHGRATVTADERRRFVVRARSGLAFDDREFVLALEGLYRPPSETPALSIVHLSTASGTARELLAPYPALLAAAGAVPFRPRGEGRDADHGLPPRAEAYLVGGLAGDAEAVRRATRDGGAGLPRRDYHGARELILGPHRLLAARLGDRVIYEVLVRTLLDPQEGAGGFGPDGAEELVPNPMRPDLGPVRPQSLRNARLDLIAALGFAAEGDEAELLPLWLRSPQRDGIAPGFLACVPVAFLLPSAGATAALEASRAAETRGRFANGRKIAFPAYRVETVNRATAGRSGALLALDVP